MARGQPQPGLSEGTYLTRSRRRQAPQPQPGSTDERLGPRRLWSDAEGATAASGRISTLPGWTARARVRALFVKQDGLCESCPPPPVGSPSPREGAHTPPLQPRSYPRFPSPLSSGRLRPTSPGFACPSRVLLVTSARRGHGVTSWDLSALADPSRGAQGSSRILTFDRKP